VVRRVEGAREYLDRPVPPADRDASLADIDRLNAWFGGYRLTLREVERLARAVPAERPLVVVDVGGGRGDFGTRLGRWARRRGRSCTVVIVDCQPVPGRPGLRAVRADATALPFRPGAVDIVTTSLTLHHLEPDAAARCLAEMSGAARLGVVINDLLRTRLTLFLVWLATRLVARHRFSRHDGPLSVRRAYSPDELRALAGKAGIAGLAVRAHPMVGRLVAVAVPGS
jgi:ubiquinone/menaquinone biosynthesis C-methylase UbiE